MWARNKNYKKWELRRDKTKTWFLFSSESLLHPHSELSEFQQILKEPSRKTSSPIQDWGWVHLQYWGKELVVVCQWEGFNSIIIHLSIKMYFSHAPEFTKFPWTFPILWWTCKTSHKVLQTYEYQNQSSPVHGVGLWFNVQHKDSAMMRISPLKGWSTLKLRYGT